MNERQRDKQPERRRLLIVGALAASGAAAVAVGIGTGSLKLPGSGTAAERSAQSRCESEVTKRLAAPDRARLTDIRIENSTLDLEGGDLFPVTLQEPLKGVATARISVLNVSGVVNAQTEVGSTIQDHFNCRAYFIDGSLKHTLVVFDESH